MSLNHDEIRPRLWTKEDLMAFLRVTDKYIYKHTQSTAKDRIPHLKLGTLLRFDPESQEFKTWLDQHRRATVDNGNGHA